MVRSRATPLVFAAPVASASTPAAAQHIATDDRATLDASDPNDPGSGHRLSGLNLAALTATPSK